MGNSHCFTSHCGSTCYAAENTEPNPDGERNYLLEFAIAHLMRILLHAPGWGRTTQSPLGWTVVSRTYWNTWYLKHEKHDTWNGTYTIERGENVGSLVWHILPPVYLLTSNSAASPGQHVWYTQSDQIPKAAATLMSKDQAIGVILIEGKDLPIPVHSKYLSFLP